MARSEGDITQPPRAKGVKRSQERTTNSTKKSEVSENKRVRTKKPTKNVVTVEKIENATNATNDTQDDVAEGWDAIPFTHLDMEFGMSNDTLDTEDLPKLKRQKRVSK